MLGVRDHVAVVVTSAVVVGGKPHPEGFALACSWLGMPAAGCGAVEVYPDLSGIAARIGFTG